MSRGGLRWGRYHSAVENCHSLSAWGEFTWAMNGDGDDGFRVKWTGDRGGYFLIDHKRDGGKYQERIDFTKTPCHYGGERDWLLCPRCNRRVGRLYLPTNIYYNQGGRIQAWRCRTCYDLTYEQRREKNLSGVMKWRADKIAQKLKHRGKFFVRPKYMRNKTFDSLVNKHNALINQADGYFNELSVKMIRRLSGGINA